MRHQASPKRAHASVLLLLILAGCAGGHPFSERSVLDALARDRIPAPEERPDASDAAQPADVALPPSGPITLADLFEIAEARSPELAAARSEVGAAAAEAWQASLYPNPSVDVMAEDISWRDGVKDSKVTVGFTQPFILGDRRRAAMNAADAERAARLASVEDRRRSLFGDIAIEHARLESLQEQSRLHHELRELAGRTLTAAESRFKASAAPETDVIRPRVELHRIGAALERIDQDIRTSAKRLGLLIGGVELDAARLESPVPVAADPLDAQRLETVVRATHPSLVVADREIEAAEARVEQVRAEKTPDLDVRVAAGYRGENDDGIVEVGAGMAIPLWDARQGDVLSARFRLMEARQRRAVTENELLSRLATAVGEHEAARAQLDTLRDSIVPDAQRAFDQTGEGYRAGRASFLDLLDAQRTLTEAKVALTELAGVVAEARARVAQIVGPEGLVPGSAPDAAETQPDNPNRAPGAEVSP